MFYVDPQRTATRRDSSLIAKRYSQDLESRQSPSTRVTSTWVPSTANLCTDSSISLSCRPRGSVRTEIITLLFESMLNSIVKSWKTLETKVNEEEDLSKALSDFSVTVKKKKSGRM